MTESLREGVESVSILTLTETSMISRGVGGMLFLFGVTKIPNGGSAAIFSFTYNYPECWSGDERARSTSGGAHTFLWFSARAAEE
jgi:hypothetical protein